jgi:branched-chain amino acid transport system permease protein
MPSNLSIQRRPVAVFLRRRSWILPLGLAILLLIYPATGSASSYWIYQISQIAILAIVVTGVNISFGYAGEVQFSQVFMFALGAYSAGVLSVHGVTELAGLVVVGIALAGIVAFAVAIPACRLGGWSLAICSFFLVIVTPDLIQILQRFTGGATGLIGIEAPRIAGIALNNADLYEVIISITIVWFALYRNLVLSQMGTLFRVLRESPVLLASIGYSSTRLKILAYVLGAVPAGIGGVLFVFVSQYLSPDTFGLALAIGIVTAAILGGVESIYGPIVGAAILQLGPNSSVAFEQYAPVAYGVFLIVVVILFRGGIGGLAKGIAQRVILHLGLGETAMTDQDTVVPGNSATVQESESCVVHRISPGPASAEASQNVLSVVGISKRFGGVTALDKVSLCAQPGSVTALIGSNGSGKTTLLNVICGYVERDSGSIRMGDGNLTGMRPAQIARQGVARTFQTPIVPYGVSVLDVVASGRLYLDKCGPVSAMLRLPRYRAARREGLERASECLRIVGLVDEAHRQASELALGMRRLTEVARALCSHPKVLLLDEPASGLSRHELELLGAAIRAASASGTAVVLIEHNFEFVVDVSDVAYALHGGKVIATGRANDLAAEPAVIESYLGSDHITLVKSEVERTRPGKQATE